jgi:calpain-15
MNICRIRNWEEVRLKGKFIRVQDIEDSNVEVVLSKWYYSLDLSESTKMFIGLHQEDERIKGVLARRPYLEVGLAIMKRTSEGVDLVDLKDFVKDRQCEIEVNLPPGSYIILPRTTGCTLRRPEKAQHENI